MSDAVLRETWRFRLGALVGDSRFLRSIGQTLATRAFTIAAGLLTSVIVTRALGPELRGSFALAMTLTAVGVQFGNLGLHASNTYTAARAPAAVPGLTANSLLVSAGIGGLLALLVVLCDALVPGVFPVTGWPFALALIGIPVGLASLLLQNLLLGVHDVAGFNALEVLTKGSVVLLSAVIILAGAVGVATMLLASLLATVAAVIAALSRLRPHLLGSFAPSRALLRSSLSYGSRAYLAALFSFLVLRVDLFMVQHYLGDASAGYYSVAVTLADMLYLVPMVIGTLLFPRLSAIADEGDRVHVATRAVAGVAGIMVLMAIIAAALSHPLIVVLYGGAFEPVVPAFVWLVPGIAMLGIHTAIMNYLAASGMPSITMYLPLAGLIANVPLNIVLLPTLGVRGASLASVIAYGGMMLGSLTVLLVRRRALLA